MINVHALRERRACMLAKLDRPTFQYEKMAGDDDALREELKVLAGKRRRFDYRRLGTLLEREGFYANHKKAFRIYTEEGPSVKRRLGIITLSLTLCYDTVSLFQRPRTTPLSNSPTDC